MGICCNSCTTSVEATQMCPWSNSTDFSQLHGLYLEGFLPGESTEGDPYLEKWELLVLCSIFVCRSVTITFCFSRPGFPGGSPIRWYVYLMLKFQVSASVQPRVLFSSKCLDCLGESTLGEGKLLMKMPCSWYRISDLQMLWGLWGPFMVCIFISEVTPCFHYGASLSSVPEAMVLAQGYIPDRTQTCKIPH